MIIDSTLEFSNSQAITAAAASTNIVDIGAARNIGVGEKRLYLVVQVDVAMTDGSSDSTVTPSIRTSATATAAAPAGALNGTITTLVTGVAFPALSAIGASQVIPLPVGSYLEFIDVYYAVANGNLTTGSFSAFIVSDTDLQAMYPVGYTIT